MYVQLVFPDWTLTHFMLLKSDIGPCSFSLADDLGYGVFLGPNYVLNEGGCWWVGALQTYLFLNGSIKLTCYKSLLLLWHISCKSPSSKIPAQPPGIQRCMGQAPHAPPIQMEGVNFPPHQHPGVFPGRVNGSRLTLMYSLNLSLSSCLGCGQNTTRINLL